MKIKYLTMLPQHLEFRILLAFFFSKNKLIILDNFSIQNENFTSSVRVTLKLWETWPFGSFAPNPKT